MKMRSAIFVFLAAIIACAEMYPKDKNKNTDITWDTKVGGGKVFGTLGQDESGLFGKGGYNKEFFNDDRGKLTAEAYGKRVLGPSGDSSSFGAGLDWTKDKAQFGVDLNKEISGRTRLSAGGDAIWKLDKNTRITAGGGYGQTLGHGKPEIQFLGTFRHDF